MRKRTILLFLLLIMCMGGGNSSESNMSEGMKKSKVDSTKVRSNVILTISEEKISQPYPTHILLNYSNSSDKEYYYDQGAYFERKINNEWYEVPESGGYPVNSMKVLLPSHYFGMADEIFDWDRYLNNLNTGEYRIVKRIKEDLSSKLRYSYSESELEYPGSIRESVVPPEHFYEEFFVFDKFMIEVPEKSTVDPLKTGSEVMVTIKEGKISKPYTEYITLSYNNNSDKHYYYSSSTQLERKINNEWYEVPKSGEYINNVSLYPLPGNSVKEELFYLAGYPENLNNGEYRIVKRIYKDLGKILRSPDSESEIDYLLSIEESIVTPEHFYEEFFVFSELMVEGLDKSTVDVSKASNEVIVIIKEEKISQPYPEYISLSYSNNSDKEYLYGKGTGLEKKINNEWYAVPLQEGYAFNDVACLLPGHSVNTELLYFDGYLENLNTGEYRIIKSMTAYLGSRPRYPYSESEIDYLLSIDERDLTPEYFYEALYEESFILGEFMVE